MEASPTQRCRANRKNSTPRLGSSSRRAEGGGKNLLVVCGTLYELTLWDTSTGGVEYIDVLVSKCGGMYTVLELGFNCYPDNRPVLSRPPNSIEALSFRDTSESNNENMIRLSLSFDHEDFGAHIVIFAI